jgi:hypothetical protein
VLFTAAAASADPLPQPLPELLQGYDTTTQITALAHWLRHQPTPRSTLGSQGVGAIRGLVATAIQHGFNHRRCNAEIAGMQFSEHLPG